MRYDDTSRHCGGDFPKSLPEAAAATHTGMFLAWALLSGLAGSLHIEDFRDQLERLKARQITPGQFFLRTCRGKFTDQDLNEQGNAFASSYLDFKHGSYLIDYKRTLGHNLPSLYHVADSWENFDRLKKLLDRRFSDWTRKSQSG